MSRKDYISAAKAINNISKDDERRDVLIETFVDFFKNDNAAFNEKRFREACHDSK